MPLFSLKQDKLLKIKKIGFNLEREIQHLTENNLTEIFGLEFVKSEFKIDNLRLDSVAFNQETSSFVIIEYKREKNFSVIDQGYAYLSALLNNKAEFVLNYNEQKNTNLKKNEVDWSQSRVIFISPQFTKYQKKAIDFKDLPIELWEITKYSSDIILFNQLTAPDTSETINFYSKSPVINKVTEEVKVYDEEDNLEGSSETTRLIYENLSERVLNLGDIEIKSFKTYISFKSNSVDFLAIRVYKNVLRIMLTNISKKSLEDPKNMAELVPKNLRFGKGKIGIDFHPEDDMDYLMTLIKQSFRKTS